MENSKAELTAYLMSERNIIGKEDVEAEIHKIYSAMPVELQKEFEDETSAAAAYYTTYYANVEGGASHISENPGVNDLQVQAGESGIVKKKTAKKESEFIAADLSSEQVDAVNKTLGSISVEQRVQATAATKIEKLLVANPHPSTFLKGVSIVPTCDADKLKEYEANLVETAENKQAFAEIKNAIAKGTKVPAYITKSQQKIEGAVVDTPEVGGKTNAPKREVLTNSTLISFLMMRVIGKIPSNPIGVRLGKFKAVDSGKALAGAGGQLGRPTLKFAKKKLAFAPEGKQYLDTINEIRDPKKAEALKKDAVQTKKVGIEPTFDVIVERDAKGEVTKTKTIRLKGSFAQYPIFDRKDGEYTEKFGAIDDRDTISGVVTETDIAELDNYRLNFVSAAISGQSAIKITTLGRDFKGLIDAATKAGSTSSASSFEA